MAVICLAPFGAIVTDITLPNPQPGNKIQRKMEMTLKRSMNGLNYTYVKTTPYSIFDYTFELDRLKSYELKAFIQSYHSAEWLLIDFNNISWKVKLKTNPSEITSYKYEPICKGRDRISLQFEGLQL